MSDLQEVGTNATIVDAARIGKQSLVGAYRFILRSRTTTENGQQNKETPVFGRAEAPACPEYHRRASAQN